MMCLLPLAGMATDLKPWYSRYLEIQPKATYLYQHYNSINDGHHNASRTSNNNFLTLSVGGAYDIYSVELETTLAATHHRSFGFCDFKLTGRYQWLDDVVGDPVSLVTGVTVIQDFKIARNDISCFYHGGIEGEFHVAVGREKVCEQFWTSRWWGVGVFGIADIGSPWIRADLGWDRNWWDVHEIGLRMYTLWGLGGERLNLEKHFHGYGPIHHQSIDLCINYHYHSECYGIFGAGYAYRVYARNCPSYVNMVELSYLYPFGL